jgi:hypothetical protein
LSARCRPSAASFADSSAIRFELFGEDQIAFGGEVEWNEEKQELRRRDRPSE